MIRIGPVLQADILKPYNTEMPAKSWHTFTGKARFSLDEARRQSRTEIEIFIPDRS